MGAQRSLHTVTHWNLVCECKSLQGREAGTAGQPATDQQHVGMQFKWVGLMTSGGCVSQSVLGALIAETSSANTDTLTGSLSHPPLSPTFSAKRTRIMCHHVFTGLKSTHKTHTYIHHQTVSNKDLLSVLDSILQSPPQLCQPLQTYLPRSQTGGSGQFNWYEGGSSYRRAFFVNP